MLKDFLHLETVRIALTHPSYAKRHGIESNQALETVGDSLLDFVVASWLHGSGISTEKDITNIRSRIVSNKNLAKIGRVIGLDKYLKVHRHTIKPKDIADAFEAFIGALSTDLGNGFTTDLLYDLLSDELVKAVKEERSNPNVEGRSEMNPVNRLQEYAQGNNHKVPSYDKSRFNGQTFKVICHFRYTQDGKAYEVSSYGVHRTKKEATKRSAYFMLKKLSLL